MQGLRIMMGLWGGEGIFMLRMVRYVMIEEDIWGVGDEEGFLGCRLERMLILVQLVIRLLFDSRERDGSSSGLRVSGVQVFEQLCRPWLPHILLSHETLFI